MDQESERLHAEADALIRAMYTGQVGWSARDRARSLKLQAGFATVRHDHAAQSAWQRLLYGVAGKTALSSLEPVLSDHGPQAGNTGLDVLLYLALACRDWLREPEEWTPTGEDARAQMASLTRHLFGLYPLPGFLDQAWISGGGEQAQAYRQWFIHLGRGDKQEALRFPMPMTHRAAHYFLQAPDFFSIPAALRYGQLQALGGTLGLAHAVAETFLSELQSDEPFWLTVLAYFVNHSRLRVAPENEATFRSYLTPAHFGPVADFIQARKFGNDAPEPVFQMKGRTVEALLRRLEEWHEMLSRTSKKGRQVWNPSGISPLYRQEPDKLSASLCAWRIVELTDTLTLAEEGRVMRHCVRSYQEGCIKGEKSIWSLRLTLSDNPTERRLLTIEVNMGRRSIVQVRGKCNQTLSAMRGNRRMMMARDILRDWAHTHHLGIACAL